MTFRPDRPYNELPDLPPDLSRIETPDFYKRMVAAHRSLAELKGYRQTLPNPELLLNAEVLQESKDSSEIENIVTTQDELYQAAAAQGSLFTAISGGTKEVLRYREAVYEGWSELKETGLLTTNTFVRTMQRLKNTNDGIRSLPGTVLHNPVTGSTIYTPPEGKDLIRDKLQALERFMNEENEIDPLVRMALAHYQFEAIHPFPDGNGRTGRILNVLYLLQQDLLHYPVLYLSAYILRHKNDYYRLLREVTERGAWAEWVSYMLEAVRSTAQATLDLTRQINELQQELSEIARNGMRNGYSSDLMQLIFRQPYSKIQMVVDAGLAGRATASKYLSELEALGILKSVQRHKEKYFVNYRLMNLLATFNA